MKWIPVTERLPNEEESNNNLLVTIDNIIYTSKFNHFQNFFVVIDPYGKGHRFEHTESEGIDRYITAWMSLPQLYVHPDRYFVRTTYIGNGVSDYKVKDRFQSEKTVFQSNDWKESKSVSMTLNKLHSEKK